MKNLGFMLAYVFDIQVSNGLTIDVGTTVPTSTITYR